MGWEATREKTLAAPTVLVYLCRHVANGHDPGHESRTGRPASGSETTERSKTRRNPTKIHRQASLWPGRGGWANTKRKVASTSDR